MNVLLQNLLKFIFLLNMCLIDALQHNFQPPPSEYINQDELWHSYENEVVGRGFHGN